MIGYPAISRNKVRARFNFTPKPLGGNFYKGSLEKLEGIQGSQVRLSIAIWFQRTFYSQVKTGEKNLCFSAMTPWMMRHCTEAINVIITQRYTHLCCFELFYTRFLGPHLLQAPIAIDFRLFSSKDFFQHRVCLHINDFTPFASGSFHKVNIHNKGTCMQVAHAMNRGGLPLLTRFFISNKLA